MRPNRRAGADRTYLQLRMRPLSPGAQLPVRMPSSAPTWVTVLLITVLAATVAVAPIVLYAVVSGHPYGWGSVERRSESYYAQLRPCDGNTVHTVEVSVYDPASEELPPAFWTATVGSPGGATAVRLFAAQPGVEASSLDDVTIPPVYTVVINRNSRSEVWVTVAEGEVGPGEVAFDGDPHVSRAEYLAMPDEDFGCAT